MPVSQEEMYARVRTAEWLLALMQYTRFLNEEFFTCVQWVTGGLGRPLQEVARKASSMRRVRGIAKAREELQNALKMQEKYLPGMIENLFEEHACLKTVLVEMMHCECNKLVTGNSDMGGVYGTARLRLARIFGLSTESLAVCEFLFILQHFSAVENYFEDSIGLLRYENRHLWASILDMKPQVLQACLGELSRCGLIERTYSMFRLNDSLLPFWDEDESVDVEQFALPVTGATLLPEAFQLDGEVMAHVRRLLEQDGQEPVHILLYGPPGTGKTSFAHSLVQVCGIRAWEVRGSLDDTDEKRRLSLTACLHLASHHPRALVIVDEAERILDTDIYPGIRTSSKSALTGLLEEPRRHVIWIVNRLENIDPAIRRRFSFSIHFERLGTREREEVWRQILKAQGVTERIDEEKIHLMARTYPVEAAIIQDAVIQAAHLHADRDAFSAALKRILLAQLTLQNDGKRPRLPDGGQTEFMPEGVCLEGDCNAILERCRRIDAAMRAGTPLRPGTGTMLFYGPPGTGKSALARHIAESLDRQCLIRRASDLLSPFVGMSEQQIAEAFALAEREGAVLVVDEVDSFLFGRDGLRHSWENSLVNEFLTALETCRGFCICTTNRRLDLDSAVMRRFSCKTAFSYAGKEQVLKLYTGLLAPLCTFPMTEGEKTRLLDLNGLVPGDFHTVRCQFDPMFMDAANLTHGCLVEALATELRLKTERRERPMGFCY